MRAVPRLTFSDCAGPAERERRLAELDAILAQPPAQLAADRSARLARGPGRHRRQRRRRDCRRRQPVPNLARARLRTGRCRQSRAARGTAGGNHRPDDRPGVRRTDPRARRRSARRQRVRRRPRGHSYRLALELGAQSERTALQFDDAIALEGVEPQRSSEIVGDGPFIAVTLNQLGDVSDPNGVVPKLAAQLTELGRCTGATVVIVPHVGDLDGAAVHDVAMASAVVAAAGDSPALRMAPLPSPEEAVWYCRHAQLVVSSRYHPTVFAIGDGTPALFLYQDHYTLVKGQGALALAGLQGWVVSAGLAGIGLARAGRAWSSGAAATPCANTFRVSTRASNVHAASMSQRCWPHSFPQNGRPRSVEPIVRPCGPSPEDEWVERAHDGLAVLHAHIAETRWQMERDAMERQLALVDRRAGQPRHARPSSSSRA